MRDETRRRLDRALMLGKLKWAAAGVLAVTVAAGAFYVENLDGTVATTKLIEGTVIHVGPPAGKYKIAVAAENLEVDIELPDNRVAHLLSSRDASPRVGDRVTIADHIHGTGRHTFGWK